MTAPSLGVFEQGLDKIEGVSVVSEIFDVLTSYAFLPILGFCNSEPLPDSEIFRSS